MNTNVCMWVCESEVDLIKMWEIVNNNKTLEVFLALSAQLVAYEPLNVGIPKSNEDI